MRSTVISFSCDGGCGKVEFGEHEWAQVPDTWYRVAPPEAGDFADDEALTFCSLECLQHWAQIRAELRA